MTRIKFESNKKSNFIKKRLIMIYDTASFFLIVSLIFYKYYPVR